MESLVALYEVIMANPAGRAFVFGLIRNLTGYAQAKWSDARGEAFDPKIFAKTIVKYEVAINAVEQLAPAVGLPTSIVGPAILVIDIAQSWARKVLGK